jgi:S-adenosyl-L-methionine hydrolase (adenosine-forming)
MRFRVIVFVMAILVGCMAAGAEARGPVILLTDYGADSIYVGMIKGAIYSKLGEAKVDTLTNSVPAFDIVTGAYMLAEGCGAFPKGTTFCCVVDPGVGTERRCIALETKRGQFFVAPDNGLLAVVAEKFGVAALRECTNDAYFYSNGSSTTFHGRDIFGPVSASLARGVDIATVGPKLERMVTLDVAPAKVEKVEAMGVVIRRDHYGNMVTNLTAAHLKQAGIERGDRLVVTVGKATYVAPFVTTYGSVAEGERLVLLQSSGFVECAMNMGSLAEAIGEDVRAKVSIKKAE